MRRDELRTLLRRVRRGKVGTEEALRVIASAPVERLGFAMLDHERSLRTGFPEVVYAEGKTPRQLIAILRRLARRHAVVLATRVTREQQDPLVTALPRGELNERARTFVLRRGRPRGRGRGHVVVLCAGTADLPVAEEALVTARAMGSRAELVADVGVAGLHRLLAHRDKLRRARVLVVVAGLEGALPSVVGGLVDRPVIAVPTSVGYGAHFRGLAPLLAMLNSCAPGITTVNVNNGFGAGYAAHLINVTGRR